VLNERDIRIREKTIEFSSNTFRKCFNLLNGLFVCVMLSWSCVHTAWTQWSAAEAGVRPWPEHVHHSDRSCTQFTARRVGLCRRRHVLHWVAGCGSGCHNDGHVLDGVHWRGTAQNWAAGLVHASSGAACVCTQPRQNGTGRRKTQSNDAHSSR